MNITIVGSGDAFATAGRAHTCIRVKSFGTTLVVDFGAGSIIGWKRLGLDLNEVDYIAISHLHGDHFGGLPFFLLDSQFASGRDKPLSILGPPGIKAKLDVLLEVFFPGASEFEWNFGWKVHEIKPRHRIQLADLSLETFEVLHPSGGLATGVRVGDGIRSFAFSGDTAWTDNLFELAADTDLFLLECYSGEEPVPSHMDWPTLRRHIAGFTSKQIVLTHMSETALAKIPEMEAAGLLIAHDGRSFDL